MFHTYSSSFAGKGSEQIWVHALVEAGSRRSPRACTPFLSAMTSPTSCKGGDLWMDSDEIRRRQGKSPQPAARPRKQGQDSEKRRTPDNPALA